MSEGHAVSAWGLFVLALIGTLAGQEAIEIGQGGSRTGRFLGY